MADIRSVRRRAAELGVQLDEVDGGLMVHAPDGYCFNGPSGRHWAECWPGYRLTQRQCCDLLMEQMSGGLQHCPPGCDCGWDVPE